MTNWLSVFKHLLPTGRAWRLTVDGFLRRFFQGLSGPLGGETKTFIDSVYDDLDPQKTRRLLEWEDQFALPSTGLTEQERRDRVEAAWVLPENQSPGRLQDALQAAGFDVYVHEWWEPIPGRAGGGSVDNDVTPVARNPFDYLDDGSGGLPYLMTDGVVDAQDGDPVSQDGATATPAGYPLVNKVLEAVFTSVGDGAENMQDGDPEAQEGSLFVEYDTKGYLMPSGADTYPYYLYIGGPTFPSQASVPVSRRAEFENLCLKICPTEQWLGILVTYS